MKSNGLSIKRATLKILPRGYNLQVIEILESLLFDAKEGIIDSIVCCSRINGEWTHDHSGCNNLFEIVGVMDQMKHLQLKRINGHE